MGCFRYIIVITLHKGDNKYDNNKEDGMYREQLHLVPGGGEKFMALKDLRQFLTLVILVKVGFELR
jgi:hypothetical protein